MKKHFLLIVLIVLGIGLLFGNADRTFAEETVKSGADGYERLVDYIVTNGQFYTDSSGKESYYIDCSRTSDTIVIFQYFPGDAGILFTLNHTYKTTATYVAMGVFEDKPNTTLGTISKVNESGSNLATAQGVIRTEQVRQDSTEGITYSLQNYSSVYSQAEWIELFKSSTRLALLEWQYALRDADLSLYDFGFVSFCDHAWSEWVEIKEATSTEEGEEERTCSICGATETRSIPVIPEETDDVFRIYGSTRYETSLRVADALKEKLGLDKFDTVILASGTNFPDALAGSYLSCLCDAPILLVNSKTNTINLVQTYIRKNLKSSGMIYMLGGKAVVPDAAVEDLNNYQIKRLAGANRYETNLKILKEADKYATNNEIIVCTGKGFADSLSAAALGRPILLVGERLNEAQVDYLASRGAANTFYLVGGTGAVNDDIFTEISVFGEVDRVWGSTRYETSVEVAKRFFDEPEAGVLAYGKNFPDGLCGGSLAYSIGGPLILTENNKIQAAINYAYEAGMTSGYVLGGYGLISDYSAEEIFNCSYIYEK